MNILNAYTTQGLKEEPVLQMGISRCAYDKRFTGSFSEKNEWIDGFQPDKKLETNLVHK